MNWLKRLRNTVDFPYCGSGYCFTSETRRQTWIVNGRKDPLHPACKQAKKEYFKGESK